LTLSTGTRLGPYEIVAPIGAGGMGEVYKAKDTRLERTVAVKVLPQHLSSSPEVRQRFERGRGSQAPYGRRDRPAARRRGDRRRGKPGRHLRHRRNRLAAARAPLGARFDLRIAVGTANQ